MASSLMTRDGSTLISDTGFKVTMWTLCGIATLFLASRFAVRMSTKGRLMVNDYFLVAAIPMLFAGSALLHSTLDGLYRYEYAVSDADHHTQLPKTTSCLTAAIEMLWISIYCVKFCFLAQFKFHKPPYAYISVHLTRYFWASIIICSAAFLFTIIHPIVLCPSPGKCRYFRSTGTVPWEMAVTAIDIVTDLLVISIPALLIHMANFTRSYTIINFIFKSLSVVNVAIAGARLALQYNTSAHRIEYVAMTLLLVVEAAIALIMASISSYRVVLLDRLAEWRMRKATASARPKELQLWSVANPIEERGGGLSSRGGFSAASPRAGFGADSYSSVT